MLQQQSTWLKALSLPEAPATLCDTHSSLTCQKLDPIEQETTQEGPIRQGDSNTSHVHIHQVTQISPAVLTHTHQHTSGIPKNNPPFSFPSESATPRRALMLFSQLLMCAQEAALSIPHIGRDQTRISQDARDAIAPPKRQSKEVSFAS